MFEGLVDLSPSERSAYLDKFCPDDPSLRAELERLLKADDEARSFMKAPAVTWTAPAGGSSIAAFSPGQKVAGRFRIIRFLGEGGMGQVYQVEDEVLGGFVALKTIRPEIASDRQTFERFKQEVRLSKEVTDENVCRVFDLDHQNAPPYITMELVEGETLSARLRREGKMAAAEALPLVEQMAHGLAAAHQKGIIHRDFKPGNVMLARTLGGGIRAKVTDFGLARTTGAESSIDPSKPVGTPPYMAPEQLEGGRGTVASDIYALGLVMYEMVTGTKPEFQRLTEQAPSPRSAVPDLDPNWETAILRCLERDPARRFASAINVVKAIRGENLEPDRSTQPMTPTHANSDQQGGRRRWQLWLLASGLAVALVAIGYLWYRSAGPPVPFENSQPTRITSTGNVARAAISPDGRYLDYIINERGKQSLWTRQLPSESTKQIIAPLDVQYDGLTFSPDGNFLYYVLRDGNSAPALYRMSLLGDLKRKLMVNVSTKSPVTFSPDGTQLAFVRELPSTGESALVVANTNGTVERVLTTRQGPDFLIAAAWSPDGKVIAFAAESFRGDAPYTSLVAIPAKGGPERPMTLSRALSRVMAMAWLSNGGGIVLASFSQPTVPAQIWHLSYPSGKLRRISSNLDNYFDVTVTSDGKTLAAVESRVSSQIWVSPTGQAAHARQLTNVAGGLGYGLSWTADTRIVYSRPVSGSVTEIWSTDVRGADTKLLAADGNFNLWPRVSPDSRYIVFTSDRNGFQRIWRMDINGGEARELSNGKSGDFAADFSPDGHWVVYRSVSYSRKDDALWKVSIDGGPPVRLAGIPGGWPSVSPDGKAVAFDYSDPPPDSKRGIAVVSMETGSTIRRFDILTREYTPVRWTPDGAGLLYIKDDGGVSNIWLQSLSGGAPKASTDFTSEEMFWFDFSRDRRQLACIRGVSVEDVVLIKRLQ
jgi:serine/threonine protein kinase/dipeptidyl aminopeptidase/acylaminoacyl peptidase